MGETESTIMTTFVVDVCINDGRSGGYSVSSTSFWRDIGSFEIPLIPLTDWGERDRR